MNNELLIVIVPALIALVGVLVTIYFNSRQQRQQSRREDSQAFTAEKRAAYKQLWEELEQTNVSLRTGKLSLDKYDQAVQQVNSFILKQALFLDAEDQRVANQYLEALRQLAGIVEKYADQIPELQTDWASTQRDIPVKALMQFHAEEQAAVSRLDELRNQIIDKCRQVLQH